MKPFKNGAKVEILYSGNDDAQDWTPGEVVTVIKPIRGLQTHGCFHGNVVIIGKGKFVEVTEPMMIRAAQ